MVYWRSMRDIIVFDIETKETFDDVGGYFPEKLTPSMVGIYSFNHDQLIGFAEEEFGKLWPYFDNADLIIGFNSDGFDIPILAKLYAPLREIQSLDLLTEIKNSAGHRVKLDSVAEATLGTHKTADGLEAITMYREGRIDDLRAYCLSDVVITRDVYLYGKKNGHILATSFAGPKQIDVNFDPAITPRESAPLSLGF